MKFAEETKMKKGQNYYNNFQVKKEYVKAIVKDDDRATEYITVKQNQIADKDDRAHPKSAQDLQDQNVRKDRE